MNHIALKQQDCDPEIKVLIKRRRLRMDDNSLNLASVVDELSQQPIL